MPSEILVSALGVPLKRRTEKACDQCRRRKVKCNGKQGCVACKSIGLKCTYGHNLKQSQGAKYVAHLEKRMAELEDEVQAQNSSTARVEGVVFNANAEETSSEKQYGLQPNSRAYEDTISRSGTHRQSNVDTFSDVSPLYHAPPEPGFSTVPFMPNFSVEYDQRIPQYSLDIYNSQQFSIPYDDVWSSGQMQHWGNTTNHNHGQSNMQGRKT